MKRKWAQCFTPLVYSKRAATLNSLGMKDDFSGQSAHFSGLKEAYSAVGDRTWMEKDFSETNLKVSRNLFTPESLQTRTPRPKAMEVYALLSGLPFAEDFTRELVSVQMRISEILGERLHYWVDPKNLGVEHCVFKWPTDPWDEKRRDVVENVLASIRSEVFRFHISGVQVNPDGCVVAKGFDENAQLFRIRSQLRENIDFLPARQSNWAHVPLGRILEPLGSARFARLKSLMRKIEDVPIATTCINTMKFIHESRWYMEERTPVAEYPLGGAGWEGVQ